MKKILLIIAITFSFNHLCFAYPISKPFPPFRIIGNLYYVGTDDLASYLIVTPKGNILINADLPADPPMIQGNIEKLGFKYSDTKILLISHAHFDHAGGSQFIKQKTQAKYWVMDGDVPVVESGGKLDFQYAQDVNAHFPESKVDKILHDGDKVKLGGSVLTAHLTAGHTPGCTTWTMTLIDHKELYHVVIIGSLNVNPGYKLVNNTVYPDIAKDFEHAFRVSKSLSCDIFLGAHGRFFNLKEKYALMIKKGRNFFIDPIGYKKYVAKKEKIFYEKLRKQKTP